MSETTILPNDDQIDEMHVNADNVNDNEDAVENYEENQRGDPELDTNLEPVANNDADDIANSTHGEQNNDQLQHEDEVAPPSNAKPNVNGNEDDNAVGEPEESSNTDMNVNIENIEQPDQEEHDELDNESEDVDQDDESPDRRHRSRHRERERSRSRDRDRDREQRRRERKNRDNDEDGNDKPPRANVNPEDEVGIELLLLAPDDVAFVVGKRGATKKKLEKISHTRMDMEAPRGQEGKLEIVGTTKERECATQFVKWVINQRNNGSGDVIMDFEKHAHQASFLEIPRSCIGVIMGRHGASLREIENEFSTLMFFAYPKDKPPKRNDEKMFKTLAIFGAIKGRLATEMKIISSVEHKLKGSYVDPLTNTPLKPFERPQLIGGDTWGVDYRPLSQSDFSYALGQRGKTKRKLAQASNCLLEYVGMCAYMVGEKEERERCQSYMNWLLSQRSDSSDSAASVSVEGRTDADAVRCPRDYVGFVRGTKGKTLRNVEEETGTFCFSDIKPNGDCRILIFGYSESNRRNAVKRVTELVRDKKGHDLTLTSGMQPAYMGGGGGGGGGGMGPHSRNSFPPSSAGLLPPPHMQQDGRGDRRHEHDRKRMRYDDNTPRSGSTREELHTSSSRQRPPPPPHSAPPPRSDRSHGPPPQNQFRRPDNRSAQDAGRYGHREEMRRSSYGGERSRY